MALDAQSARFFAADDDRFAFHQGADVFEANRGFMHFHAEQTCDSINLMARGYGPYRRAGPAAIVLQMIKSQCEDLVGSQPGPVLIHNAKPFGFTIQAEA